MFRYLLKYVGTYKVLTELTTDTNDFVRDYDDEIHPDYDELYIPCANEGVIKHTYSDSILAYITPKVSMFKKYTQLLKEGKISFTTDDSAEEFIIYFNDADMHKVAKILGAKTRGRNVPPFDKSNIPDRIILKKEKKEPQEIHIINTYTIPSRDWTNLYTALAPIQGRSEKMKFTKETLEEFDKEIAKIKGDGFNVEAERKKANLPQREFIHYLGLWDRYIEFIKLKVSKS